MSEHIDPLDLARDLAGNGSPAESPDERSVPFYLQSIALSLADIAQTLRNHDWREVNR